MNEILNHKHGPYIGKRALLSYFRGCSREGISGLGINTDIELARCECCNALIKPPKGLLWFTQTKWPITAMTGILWILAKCGINSAPILLSLFLVLFICVCLIIPVAWAYFGCWEVATCEVSSTKFIEQQLARVHKRNTSPKHKIKKVIELVAFVLSIMLFYSTIFLAN